MKNKFIIATFFSIFLLIAPNVQAANFTDNQTVDSNKTWTIKFTSDVGLDDGKIQGITVTDSTGAAISVDVKLGEDSKTVIVTAPEGGYTPGESYVLDVGTKAHSSKGTALKNEYKLHFNIDAPAKIDTVSAVDGTITVKLNKAPSTDVKLEDFEIRINTDDPYDEGPGNYLVKPTNISKDTTDLSGLTYKLTIPEIIPRDRDQRVMYTVDYKESGAKETMPFVIPAIPAVDTVIALGGTIIVKLAKAPLTDVTKQDFKIYVRICSGIMDSGSTSEVEDFTVSKDTTDSSGLTYKLTVPAIIPPDDKEFVYIVSYKGSDLKEAPPIMIVKKPNIYLYPEKTEELSVYVNPKGKITKSIPDYNEGWKVTVDPNGKIDNTYDFLFYEASLDYKFTLNQGWIVNKDNFNEEMNTILTSIGLSSKEKADFIEYWSKRLNWQNNRYVAYYLDPKEINEAIKLNISKEPDSILRVFFYFVPLNDNENLEIKKPEIKEFKRNGFTVVEWGGIGK